MIINLATSQNQKERKEKKTNKQTWVGVVIFFQNLIIVLLASIPRGI
jgi:anaerobic C4-dicarboxylate transporter